MKVLIVDSNLVFAKEVGRFLQANLKQADVDYATNVPVLKRRLAVSGYDYIIADVTSAFDSDGMTEVLRATNIPTVIWSAMTESSELFDKFRPCKVISKPVGMRAIAKTASAISTYMLPTVGG